MSDAASTPEPSATGPATAESGFADRHIGWSAAERDHMLGVVGYATTDELVATVVPNSILATDPLALPPALSETEALAALREHADANTVMTSLIGAGYSGTHTPGVILRNIFENPAWYTAYTPYQPEISQGRLEALINFQTMISDLTGLDLANASMLDEATAAAEAMAMGFRSTKSDSMTFLVDQDCHPQVIEVCRTRAEPLGITVVIGDVVEEVDRHDPFGALLAYPGTSGTIRDLRPITAALSERGAFVAVASDLLALCVLSAPGDWGVDAVVGSSQRFGVPLGFGGPHAGFLATRDAHKRTMPGRLVGVSVDTEGRTAYRLSLQTREQHIRREKATSNICTAQVLLAVMASMYAVYHGPDGLRAIAGRVARLTRQLAELLRDGGIEVLTEDHFDTIQVRVADSDEVLAEARARGINLRRVDGTTIGISLDETTTPSVVTHVLGAFGIESAPDGPSAAVGDGIPDSLRRHTEFLTHPTFHRYRSETEMLRYLRRLADLDIALDRSMIPLGSCTMKLNATSEMIPVTWPEFAAIHPFAPTDQVVGYHRMIRELEDWLAEITGYDAVSVQPNAGSQGEYAGLLAIRAYHRSRGDSGRDVCLIPSSAHGTNAASAVMAGMRVVVVACDVDGNVDVEDLRARAGEHRDRLAAIMVTYPSTHGVFEDAIGEICAIVHDAGGQVYVDGANLNALVGVARPGRFGSDVSHLNLHKTFCIPHGGGGPGVGPIGVRSHLAPFLPSTEHTGSAGATGSGDSPEAVGAVSAAPYGSAGILAISWMYIAMMGPDGLRAATHGAILGANYVARRLSEHYPILYSGAGGLVAHECIVDIRPIEKSIGISAEDIAKRLIDYGFHAPTMSFPVAGTLMIEPTESESLGELDRFCDAMIQIASEIAAVGDGTWPIEDNPLVRAPHTAEDLLAEQWDRPYSRELAAYPVRALRSAKYWPPVSRIDGGYGDRNLMCSCPPVSDFAEEPISQG